MIKIVATRCHILRLKYTKFDFSWGSAPDPAERAHCAPQTLWLNLRGPTSKGRRVRGIEKGEGNGRKGEGEVGDSNERRGKVVAWLLAAGWTPLICTWQRQ